MMADALNYEIHCLAAATLKNSLPTGENLEQDQAHMEAGHPADEKQRRRWGDRAWEQGGK